MKYIRLKGWVSVSLSLPSRFDMGDHPDSTRNLVILIARVTAHLLQESSRLEEAEAAIVVVDNYAEIVTEGSPPGTC